MSDHEHDAYDDLQEAGGLPEAQALAATIDEGFKIRSHVWIAHDVCCTSTRPVPNAWRRFWHRALLGWRWESDE